MLIRHTRSSLKQSLWLLKRRDKRKNEWYYGPTDYKLLKRTTNLEDIVALGWYFRLDQSSCFYSNVWIFNIIYSTRLEQLYYDLSKISDVTYYL
jgi:hypothetical protein